ncbi:endonuclease/exonuclease/phosphatase family protein [Sanguibacter inulinus]|uniref:Endonuclease n=1 Tax=Sanguibacter inulinus TaxID=60922 RepID=A0A853F060_9MICO|nr:endonuclease/exonuclease/phosphatase family protein [Sanguibacter inulinus]MBF0723758.1 endonuclease [Sanguibacter inulinus]NYS94903.1 endonuclease [Sanguibacter inulinus]
MTDISPPVAARTCARLVLLLAVVTALTADLVRTSGPLIDQAFTAGVVQAGATAVGTYAAAGALVALVCLRRQVAGPALVTGVVSLVVLRLAVQATQGSARFVLGLVAVALALAVLVVTAAVAARVSGRVVAAGVSGGLALSAALTLAWSTWDPVWRPGVVAWVTPVLLGGVAVLLARGLRRLPAAPAVRGLWLLGPFVGLAVMTVANPAFLASQTGLPLWVAGPLLLVPAVLVAVVLVLPVARTPRTPAWIDGLLVVVLGSASAGVFAAATWPHDPGAWRTVLVCLSLLVLAVGAPLALARALTRPVRDQSSARLAGAAACAGLGVIVPLLVYQLDYDVPLGVPNAVVPVLVAVLLSIMAARARSRARASERDAVGTDGTDGTVELSTVGAPLRAQLVLVTLTCALLVVGTAVVLPSSGTGTPADERPPVADGTLQMLDWNLHYGVSTGPGVELDEMVDVIAGSGAQLVTLQEVSRGWVMGGGSDMATYLEQRLGMHSAFVPAADRQFGNMILWDESLGDGTDIDPTALPYGAGPQRRSAVNVTLDVDGTPLRVTSVHLQHRMGNIDTRLDQIAALLDAEPVVGARLVAGDLNAEPGWPEVALFEAAGLTSAVDEAGDPLSSTFPSDAPSSRIDWIFGAGVSFSDVEVLDVRQSDHRPLVATVSLP